MHTPLVSTYLLQLSSGSSQTEHWRRLPHFSSRSDFFWWSQLSPDYQYKQLVPLWSGHSVWRVKENIIDFLQGKPTMGRKLLSCLIRLSSKRIFMEYHDLVVLTLTDKQWDCMRSTSKSGTNPALFLWVYEYWIASWLTSTTSTISRYIQNRNSLNHT